MRTSSASSQNARGHASPALWLAVVLVATTGTAGCEAAVKADPPLQPRSDGVGTGADLRGLDTPWCGDEGSSRASSAATLSAIGDSLLVLAAQFSQALPAKASVRPFFDAAGFDHHGLGLDAYLDQVLLKPRASPDGFDFVGLSVSDLEVVEAVDSRHAVVTYTVAVKHSSLPPGPGSRPSGRLVSFRPWTERMLMTRVCGRWLLSGNQTIARASVNFLARLAEKPLTQAELDARPGVFTILASWDPLQRMAYLMRVTPDITGWIGYPGDSTFGVVAWVGDNMDYPWTPDVNERELRRQYNQYLAAPSSRVHAYMVFDVSSTEIDPRVASVHVTGPGLPSSGLNLVRSPLQYPRPNLIFRGDLYHWDAFSTQRCSTMSKLVDDPADPRDYIPDCALDWSQIHSGSSYLYAFLDAGGNVLGQLTRQLQGDVLGEEAWYAARERFYGQYTLDPPFQFTIANVLDTSPGSPFGPGGTVELTWRLPASEGVQLEGFSYWRQYALDNDFFNPSSQRQEEHWYQLYGTEASSWSAASEPNDWLTTWAWSTVIFRDRYGNQFEHEVSPVNPY